MVCGKMRLVHTENCQDSLKTVQDCKYKSPLSPGVSSKLMAAAVRSLAVAAFDPHGCNVQLVSRVPAFTNLRDLVEAVRHPLAGATCFDGPT